MVSLLLLEASLIDFYFPKSELWNDQVLLGTFFYPSNFPLRKMGATPFSVLVVELHCRDAAKGIKHL